MSWGCRSREQEGSWDLGWLEKVGVREIVGVIVGGEGLRLWEENVGGITGDSREGHHCLDDRCVDLYHARSRTNETMSESLNGVKDLGKEEEMMGYHVVDVAGWVFGVLETAACI